MEQKEIIQTLLQKIPLLRGNTKEIFITHANIELMTDIEFIVFWNMPNLIVRCYPHCIDLIDKRRKKLNLKETKYASIQKN